MSRNRKEEIYLQGRCPCWECSGTKLDEKLVDWVLDFEQRTGLKIDITSGARCESYNRKVGGFWNSPHLIDTNKVGHAIDFQIKGMKPIEIAFKVDETGLKRIGIYKSHIHGDMITPSPSKYWYVGRDGTTIYSRHINDLRNFLIQMKKEGRLSSDENNTLNYLIVDSFVDSVSKKDSKKKL